MARYHVTVTVSVSDRGPRPAAVRIRSEVRSWLEDIGWTPETVTVTRLEDEDDVPEDDSDPAGFGACGDCPDCGSLSPGRCGCADPEPFDVPDMRRCSQCGGGAYLMGVLGTTAHYRCRQCGWTLSLRGDK